MSWDRPESFPEHMLSTMLSPLSAVYGVGSQLRRHAYQMGFFDSWKLKVRVLSVGNITVGGTGKTPVTIDLARRFMYEGHRVAILSRGYNRRSSAPTTVVSDGTAVLADVEASGDEPYMIAREVPKAVVIVGKNRRESARRAIEQFNANLIILDDGFQHLPIRRDADVVLLDYHDDLESLRILPAGRLREPVSALSRADWIVVSKLPENPDLERLQKIEAAVRRLAPRASVSKCRFEPDSVHRLDRNARVSVVTQIAGMKVFAFCGIARPESFRRELCLLGAEIVGQRDYPDHHWLSRTDVATLIREFRASGAQMAVTTSKDAVRLPEHLLDEIPVGELRLRTEWLGPVPHFTGDGTADRGLELAAGAGRR